MTPQCFALTPQDAWFFRDGRPYNERESNQADVESQFPPPARTLTGAVRAALARANGWDGRSRWSDELNRRFGSGPKDLGDLQFTGPFLLRHAEALWPVPRHLLGCSPAGRWTPTACLRPGTRETVTDQGSVCLPEKTLPLDGLKPAETAWLTAAGWTEVLAGKLPDAKAVRPVQDLWKLEPRVGFRRDPSTLNVGEGALYSPSYVRLGRGVSLGFGFAGLPERMNSLPGLFPLGGESRLAQCESWEGNPLPPAPSSESFQPNPDGSIEFTVSLLTPGRLATKQSPLSGVELVSACIGKPAFIGGWDSLKREPLRLEPFLPAGSVWFCRVPPAQFPSVRAQHGRWQGDYTAHGFGQIAIGHWPQSQTSQR